MPAANDSTRILRLAARIWIGFLLAMLLMDLVLYLPQVQRAIAQNVPLIQQTSPIQPPPFNSPARAAIRLFPVILYYITNLAIAITVLASAFWKGAQNTLGKAYYPLVLFAIAATPILINAWIVPRFPPGPLANAEGMALRQLPVLIVALALVAWEYRLAHVIGFSLATSVFELILIFTKAVEFQNIFVFIFIAVIRTISFIAIGIFINLLVSQLRQQRETLREANANLTHYASTLEQLTVSRERNRLARELHDTLAHSLTALSVSLETVKAYFDLDKAKTREMIDVALESTRKGVDETRRALKSLRSSDLEDLGLGLALQRVAESAASRFKLDLELGLPSPMPSLSPDVEQAIYRVAQEAIQNVTSHSGAKKFSLHLAHNHRTMLTIQDNGIGFDASKSASGRFGLIGMRERAELAGGTLKVESAKGEGTKVMLEI
ncbi:MAG TPA: sensor histidine kinase [Anaerolineales bacterium]|nr:sensor histidine kinase [Anaerolineales bacterium]HMR99107.1 sensor histidine kinase [Anaerolineales bacterium]HNQ94239.1 sensor histidine kinase [Anaerolineales bacterium]HNS61463.1 sensor histidine kinase [Anaerolineales bacterium]